jgi:uncharacterized protein (TIRG00374 family)
MFYINSQGAVMDSITPGVKIGGEITRAVQITKITGCPGEQAAAIVAMQKIFSLSALFSIQLFAVGYLIGNIPLLQNTALQILIYGLPVLFLSATFGVFIVPHRFKEALQSKKAPKYSWSLRVRNFLITLADHLSSVRKQKKALTALVFLSYVIWLLYPIKMFIITIQFAPDISLFYVGAIAFVSYMVAMLPIFPGGLGGFEGTMTGLLLVVGFGINDAAVVTVLFRFVTFWFVLLLSLGYVAFHRLTQRQSAQSDRQR